MQRKEIKKVLRELERQNFRVKETTSGYMIYAPDGKNMVSVHTTTSDHRSWPNAIARLRRFGFKWKGR